MTALLKLGMAVWSEGKTERQALVAPLPSDPARVVDLHRIERARLAKLGEGRPETLAEVLVPPSLRPVLEGGPRALQRLRQTLAYAEKWARRGDLPETLAPQVASVRLLPCLLSPAELRRSDGTPLDPPAVRGPGATMGVLPQPTLALVGLHRGGSLAGWCLALEDTAGVVLGGWLVFQQPGPVELHCGGHHRRIPADAWAGLAVSAPGPAEAVILPAPRLRPLPGLVSGSAFEVVASFERLPLTLGPEIPHATVQ